VLLLLSTTVLEGFDGGSDVAAAARREREEGRKEGRKEGAQGWA
jgi:hypothetical protein